MAKFLKHTDGFGLVEIVVATAVVVASFFALTAAVRMALNGLQESAREAQASFLLEEAVEAVRSLRDESWGTYIAPVATSTAHYPVFSGGRWTMATSNPGLIDGTFTRTVVLEDVWRKNADDDIVDAGAPDPKTFDPGTKRVVARVSWGTATPTETLAVAYEGGATDGDLGNFPSNNSGNGDPAQGVTTLAEAVTVPRVELYMRRATANPSDIYLEIRETSTVGSVLATSQTVDGAALPATLSWVSFSFASAPTLDPSTIYHLRLRSVPDSTVAFSGSVGTVHWAYRQTGPSPYAGGIARRYVGRLSNPSDQGQALAQYDFSFRVYGQDSSGAGRTREIITYITNMFSN